MVPNVNRERLQMFVGDTTAGPVYFFNGRWIGIDGSTINPYGGASGLQNEIGNVVSGGGISLDFLFNRAPAKNGGFMVMMSGRTIEYSGQFAENFGLDYMLNSSTTDGGSVTDCSLLRFSFSSGQQATGTYYVYGLNRTA
jgi:hypothetical protein